MTFTEQQREAFVLLCDRCGQPAEVAWCDVSVLARKQYLVGETRCLTPGCFDETGSRQVELPPGPGELTRDDRAWLRWHERLTALRDTP
jgi:hypothetical protein